MSRNFLFKTRVLEIAMSAICMCGSGLQAAEQCEFEIKDQTVSIWLKDVTGLTNIDKPLLQKQLLGRAPFVTCRWKASEMNQGKSRLNNYTPRFWTKDTSSQVNRLVLTALNNDKIQKGPDLPEEIIGDPNGGYVYYTMVAAAKDLGVNCTQPSAFGHSGPGWNWPDSYGEKNDFTLKYIQHPSGSYVRLKKANVWRYLDDSRGVVNYAIPGTSDNDSSFVADCNKKQLLSFSGTIYAEIDDRELIGVIKKYVKLKIVKSLRSSSPSFQF